MIVKGMEIQQCFIRLQKIGVRREEMSTTSKDIKRSLRKRVQIKEESDEEDNESYELEDSESEDPDYEEEIKKKKSIKKERLSKTINPKIKRNLGPYEQMIQKNREEATAFLQFLKIQEAKDELSKAVDSMKKRPKPVKRKCKEEVSPPVLRKSTRLENLQAALYLKAAEESNVKRTIPAEMSFKDAFTNESSYETYVADVPIQESKSEAKFITYDKTDLEKMTLSESSIAKITPGRITALSWYPSPEQLIIAAGDKYGNLGVLNVNGESDPYVMNIHLERITNLQFNPFNQVQLISSSHDGIVRCGDMVQHKFNEIYNVSDTTCTYFDILSQSTFLVAQANGQVAVVDRRTEGKIVFKGYKRTHNRLDCCIKTVNIHPVNRSFFITAENRGSIRLWDLRMLCMDPVADITYHKRSVSSAYFSPVTGNSILASSRNDTVSIFDSSSLTNQVKLKQRMRCDNRREIVHGGLFRAIWLPNSEEAFVVGNERSPCKIKVFDKNMMAYSVMMHEDLGVTETNIFHPTRLALAGGNSSGKVFVFK